MGVYTTGTSWRIARLGVAAAVGLIGLLVGSAPAIAFLGLAALTVAAVPVRRHRPSVASVASSTELETIQAIVDRHGTDSLSPFIVRPDKTFALTGPGVIAYRRVGRTLVVSGDPVGPVAATPLAIDRLLALAAEQRATPVIYGASDRHLAAYRAAGLHAVCVGEEAVVDPATFSLQGRAVRKLRQSVARVGARGWAVSAVDGRDITPALGAELAAVERAWRAQRPQILGFAMSMGEHEAGARPDDLVLLARAPGGELRAVMRFISHRGNLSLDTMRRVGDTPNGLNEALVCEALRIARQRGVTEVSLNYAGLAHLLRDRTDGRAPAPIARLLAGPLGRRFQMERLVRFNDKFSPHWRPRYLVFGSRLSLPRSIYRVLQAEGYVRMPRTPAAPGRLTLPIRRHGLGHAVAGPTGGVRWEPGR